MLPLFPSSFVAQFTEMSGRRFSRQNCSSPSFQAPTFRLSRMYFPWKSRQFRTRHSRTSCCSLMAHHLLAATCGASTSSCSLSHFLASLRVVIFPSLAATKYSS